MVLGEQHLDVFAGEYKASLSGSFRAIPEGWWEVVLVLQPHECVPVNRWTDGPGLGLPSFSLWELSESDILPKLITSSFLAPFPSCCFPLWN